MPRLRALLIALPLVLMSVVPAALGAAPQNIGRVRIKYVPPTDSAHQPIYDAAKKVRVLEYVKSALIEIRLPRVLWIKLAGCDGEANASYGNTRCRLMSAMGQKRTLRPALAMSAMPPIADKLRGGLFVR